MCLLIAIERPEDILATGKHLGFEWAVAHNGMGYRCGYVRVPLGHPWHGKSYNDLDVDVHGGLSFAEPDEPCDGPGTDADWWLGFDCAHAFDAPDPELPLSETGSVFPFGLGEVRNQAYVEHECRSLCHQASIAS